MDIPSNIGKYKIETLIAKGGMGEVYKGLHPTLNRHVILKKLTMDSHMQFVERFNREARIMMDFKNDNIVDVYDHFEEGNSYYIVLEYIDGISLDKFLLKERYLSNDLALHITGEVSKALKYAHDKNVIHRDIKPGNILLSKKGEVKLVDFGIASLEEDTEIDLTREGMTLGTPSYMAPEQFTNSKNVDKRADIYSVGVMLYVMVTGKKPYPSGLNPTAINQIRKGRHKSPKKINPKVNNTVLRLIKKLMKPNIKRRVQDLGYLNLRLNRYFKNIDINQLKTRIADIVEGREPQEQPEKSKFNIIIPLLVTTSLLIAGIFAYTQNYYYEFIKTDDYGLIKLNLIIGDSYHKNIDDISIDTRLYRETDNKLEFLESEPLNFRLEHNGSDSVFSTGNRYLPTGNYRIKVSVDGNLFWNNFSVESRKEQKKRFNRSTGLGIDLKYKKQRPLPFQTYISVYDSSSGETITSTTEIFIKEDRKYREYVGSEENLETGKIYFFKFMKEGYSDKEYILKIDNHQSDLTINVELFPESGKKE